MMKRSRRLEKKKKGMRHKARPHIHMYHFIVTSSTSRIASVPFRENVSSWRWRWIRNRGPGGEINEQGPSENEKGGTRQTESEPPEPTRPSQIWGLVGKFGRRLFPVQCRMLFMKLRAHVPLCRLVRAREPCCCHSFFTPTYSTTQYVPHFPSRVSCSLRLFGLIRCACSG